MISLARIFEAWRDAQIFKDPTVPRGKLWHLFKYPQYGLLISSALVYFLVIREHVSPLSGFKQLFAVALVISIDGVIAFFVFEFFLNFFRGRRIEKDRLARVLEAEKIKMGNGS